MRLSTAFFCSLFSYKYFYKDDIIAEALKQRSDSISKQIFTTKVLRADDSSPIFAVKILEVKMNREIKDKLEKINQKYLLGRGVFKNGLSKRCRILSSSNRDASAHYGVYLVANLLTSSGEQEFIFDEFMNDSEISSKLEIVSSVVTEVRESDLPHNDRISLLKSLNNGLFNGNGRWKIENGVYSKGNNVSNRPTRQIVLLGSISSKKYPDRIEVISLKEYDSYEDIKRKVKRAKAILGYQ